MNLGSNYGNFYRPDEADLGGWMTFSHSDWLGTERVRSNVLGASCETISSLPFGDGQAISGSCGDPTPMHFTGKERDSEAGLDNFGARYDSSSVGRFMSADPANIAGDLLEWESPQSWNAYSYVQNDPINATDPDGLDCVYVSGNQVFYNTGNCIAGMNGTYVNGTIDPKSGSYDPNTGTVSFNYANTNSGTGTTFGKGVISNVYPTHPGQTESEKFASRMAAGADNMNAIALQVGLQAGASALGGVIRLGTEAALAGRAARAAAQSAVDLQNVSSKIVRQMLSRGWTNQAIVDTIKEAQEAGTTYPAINKATGSAATEFVSESTGKFVVIDNTTKEIIQVSGPGFKPNYMAKP